MARRHGSPTLKLRITEEQHDEAVKAQSGGCLIADAIKKQYPHLSNVAVDMVTIRATDRKRGERYTYLTPADAQKLLLYFDQGWPNPTEELTIRHAVKITAVVNSAKRNASREEKLAELEQKVERGEELNRAEKGSLTQLRKRPARPTTRGKSQVKGRHGRDVVVVGGSPVPAGKPHPNLLAGRDRHFGAKLADPGEVFKQAVDEAVEARIAELATEAAVPA